MSKKAQTIMGVFESIWELVLVVIICICIIGVVAYYLNEVNQTQNAEMQVLFTKFIYSPDCLAYNDSIKTYPGLIDYNKFTSTSNIPNCKIKDTYGVRLTLKKLDNSVVTPNPLELLTPEKKGLLSPVCPALPNFKCFTKTAFVNYIINGEIKPGILQMEVIRDVEQ